MTDWRGAAIEVRLGSPGHGGFCVARHEGRVVFVRHGLPGELVLARVTEDKGGSFCRADAIDIVEPSPDRVAATCPVSGPGGAGCCDFSHATPVAQRALKASVVAEQLRRLADVVRDVTVEPIPGFPADSTGGWRTRIRLTVDGQGRAGVHRYRSTDVLTDLCCPQPVPGAMTGVAERAWTPGADLVIAVDGDGARHLVELAPAATGVRGRRGERRQATARRAATHAPRAEKTRVGSGRSVEYVSGRRWELSATGFWQAHRGAAQCYSDLVAEWAGLDQGGVAWDLYGGVGVFAARLAEQVGSTGSVLAVESARSAVADGNAAMADLPRVQLSAQRVQPWLTSDQGGQYPNVVVLDPPRDGAGKEVIAAVAARRPERIIHLGCDPAAFARDVGLYQRSGYRLADLRVFDAFPGTHHVECVALLAAGEL